MRRHIDRIEGTCYERGYVYSFHFHLIWVTKYRRQVFTTPALVSEMKGILRHVAEVSGVTVEEMEVMPDHVHMLISFRPKHAPTDVVKNLKGGKCRHLPCRSSRNQEGVLLGRPLAVKQLLHEHAGKHEPGHRGEIHPEPVCAKRKGQFLP